MGLWISAHRPQTTGLKIFFVARGTNKNRKRERASKFCAILMQDIFNSLHCDIIDDSAVWLRRTHTREAIYFALKNLVVWARILYSTHQRFIA